MTTHSPEVKQPVALLRVFAQVDRGELARVTWSFLFFFTLLGGYFMLRPVRDAVAVANGVNNIPWLFTATLAVMLLLTPVYGWVVARFPRRVFLPVVYIFFIVNLLLFYALFELQVAPQAVTRIFFVWLSVFNLFVVSVFWSFMVDIYNSSQARRLFGLIAAGGSLGAILGPLLTATLAELIGVPNLLLGATVMISLATVSIFILRRHSREEDPAQQVEDREIMGGSILEGALRVVSSRYLLMICGLMLLHNTSATFLYNLRAHTVAAASDDFVRYTEIFGWVDFSVNIVALLLQAMITIRLVRRFGMAQTLMAVPLILLLGFSAIGLMPALLLILTVQVAQRSMNYGILGPTKEMLFAPVDREIKYKSKNFIDTVVYRGSDTVSIWLFRALHGSGWSLSALAWLLLPFIVIWAWLVWRLGHHYQSLHEASLDLEHTSHPGRSDEPAPDTDKGG
ncbi:MAG: MFS transporter [Wenzhouxiangellaceae bacterium]